MTNNLAEIRMWRKGVVLIGFFFSCCFTNVDATCLYSGPDTVQIKETDKDVPLVNTSSSSDTKWSMSVSVRDGPVNMTMFSDFFHVVDDNETYVITLTRELDKESFCNDYNVNIDVIVIKLHCQQSGNSPIEYNVRVVIDAVNEFPPQFVYTPYKMDLPEDTPVDSTVYSFTNITDKDRPLETMEYQIVAFYNATVDGSSFLELPLGSVPDIVLRKRIDYDELRRQANSTTYYLVFQVSDMNLKHSASTTLAVHVTDVDDLPPIFIPSCGQNCITQYRVDTQSDYIGELDITPNAIEAHDQDSFNFSISYTFDKRSIEKGFRIDQSTGTIWKNQQLGHTDLLIVTATENEGNRRSAKANVLVVIDGDPSLPQAQASQNEKSDDSFKYVAIAIAVVLLLVIAVSIALVIYLVKKVKRSVNKVDIEPSPTTSRETLSQSDRSRNVETTSTQDWVLQQQDLKPQDIFPLGKNAQLPPLKKPEKLDKTTEAKIKRKKKKKKKTILKRQLNDEGINDVDHMSKISEREERILID